MYKCSNIKLRIAVTTALVGIHFHSLYLYIFKAVTRYVFFMFYGKKQIEIVNK